MASMNQNRLLKSTTSFFLVLFSIVFCIHHTVSASQPEQSNSDSLLISKAAQNIVSNVTKGTHPKVFVICSKSKQKLADEIIKVLEAQKISNIQLVLDSNMDSEIAYFKDLITNLS